MATAAFTNGFGGNVTFGSFTFSVVEYQVKIDNGLIDVTNTGSSNWKQFISGVNEGTISMKTYWDTANIYTTSPANLYPGQTGTGTFLIGNTGKSFVCTLYIKAATLTNSPTNGVTYDIETSITSQPTFPS